MMGKCFSPTSIVAQSPVTMMSVEENDMDLTTNWAIAVEKIRQAKARKLIVAFVLVCCFEIVALLWGFRVLPHLRGGLVGYGLMVGAMAAGVCIEQSLYTLAGGKTESEKELLDSVLRSQIYGAIYIIPVIMARVGTVVPWFLPISIVVFVGLILRLAWVLSGNTTPRESASQNNP
jgi:hypothetical protein